MPQFTRRKEISKWAKMAVVNKQFEKQIADKRHDILEKASRVEATRGRIRNDAVG